jgi:phosphatidylcholine synthase
LTASGAALALLALIFAAGGHWAVMFLCLGIAMIVDGIDGPLARQFNVARKLPRYSGDTLDLVVDFTSYVFVPAFAIATSGLMPALLAISCGAIIVVTGALYFADQEMKTRDNHFRGFPGAWNLVAFYLFVLDPPAWIAAVTIGVCAALTFAPVTFVHPVRVTRLRSLNLAMMGAWAILAALAVIADLDPGRWVIGGLCLIAVYFFGVGLFARRA